MQKKEDFPKKFSGRAWDYCAKAACPARTQDYVHRCRFIHRLYSMVLGLPVALIAGLLVTLT